MFDFTPTAIKLATLAAVVAALTGLGWYAKGVLEDREKLALQVNVLTEARKLDDRVASTTSTVLSNRVQSAAAISTKAKDVQVAIEARLPDNAGCMLSADWRVLVDSAAADVPVPGGPPGADVAPISPKAAARSIAGNYATSLDNADRLLALQAWLAGLKKETPK